MENMFDIDNKWLLSSQVMTTFEYRKWASEMPAINFKEEWDVKMLPPFGGAVARFSIECNGKHISVYLDCYDMLACYGEPYWEMYPYEDDVARFPMADVKSLLAGTTRTGWASATTAVISSLNTNRRRNAKSTLSRSGRT